MKLTKSVILLFALLVVQSFCATQKTTNAECVTCLAATAGADTEGNFCDTNYCCESDETSGDVTNCGENADTVCSSDSGVFPDDPSMHILCPSDNKWGTEQSFPLDSTGTDSKTVNENGLDNTVACTYKFTLSNANDNAIKFEFGSKTSLSTLKVYKKDSNDDYQEVGALADDTNQLDTDRDLEFHVVAIGSAGDAAVEFTAYACAEADCWDLDDSCPSDNTSDDDNTDDSNDDGNDDDNDDDSDNNNNSGATHMSSAAVAVVAIFYACVTLLLD